jgi:hypothetical protein
MKSLDEIESILKQSYSDPIVRMAAEDALKWARIMRQVAMAKGFLEGVRATEERDNARD